MITITSSDHWSYWSSSIPSYDRKISNDKKVVDNLFIFQSNFIMNYPFTPCSTVQSSLERINGIVATVVIIPTNAEGEEKDILKKKFQGINKKNYFFGNFIINFWNEILNIFLWFKLQIMCVCMWKHCIIIIIIINSLKKQIRIWITQELFCVHMIIMTCHHITYVYMFLCSIGFYRI